MSSHVFDYASPDLCGIVDMDMNKLHTMHTIIHQLSLRRRPPTKAIPEVRADWPIPYP